MSTAAATSAPAPRRRQERDALGAGAPDHGRAAVGTRRRELGLPARTGPRQRVREVCDQRVQRLDALLERMDLGRSSGRGTRLEDDVLVVVVELEREHVEAGPAEEPRERAGAEVRAVLVVDVPEGGLAQHAHDVRQLEQDDRLLPLADPRADARHEVPDRRDVLERVPADDGVRVERAPVPVVQRVDEGQAARRRRRQPLLDEGRVDAEPAVPAQLAHHREELALAAADLDDCLPRRS